jgi:hypothetical protein
MMSSSPVSTSSVICDVQPLAERFAAHLADFGTAAHGDLQALGRVQMTSGSCRGEC